MTTYSHQRGYPDPEAVRNILSYDAKTGIITNRISGGRAFTATCKGYFAGRLLGGVYRAHSVIWAIVHGVWPQQCGLVIDHINGDRSDNRLENLRCVTQQENTRNRHRAKSVTGVTGVSVNKRGRYVVQIHTGAKNTFVGEFGSLDEAVIARKDACLGAWGYVPYALAGDVTK